MDTMMNAAPSATDESLPHRSARTLWSDECLVGLSQMDEMHKEFFVVARRLLICQPQQVDGALGDFIVHAQHHFGEENDWMRSTNFPPADCHIHEHDDVLRSAEELRRQYALEEVGLERIHEFATFLFEWFPGHVDYLDSALAAWISKKQYGGKPVVLRRSLDMSASTHR